MKLGRKRKNLGGIPTTSTSDISFLLLVFFLSTTTFDIKKGLGLMLSAAKDPTQKDQKLNPKNKTIVRIAEDGSVRVDGEKVPLKDLKELIRNKVKDNPDMVIVLKVIRTGKYDYMVRVLDIIQAAKAEKIKLISDKNDD